MLADQNAAPTQLLLSFPVNGANGRDDFLTGESNRSAIDLIDSWPDWPGPVQLIVGPPGSGKSHLASIWAERTGALVTAERYFASALLDAFENDRCVVLELGDAAALDETALFHVLNAVRQNEGYLLITARRRPEEWGLRLADLISRLRSIPVTPVGTPEENLIRQVIVKLFADRQLPIENSVLDYALLRLERTFEAANLFVKYCDETALRSGRKITRPVASAALEQVAGDLLQAQRS